MLNKKTLDQLIDYNPGVIENGVTHLLRTQERNGFKFDVFYAQEVLEYLEAVYIEKRRSLDLVFPPERVVERELQIKYKKDGSEHERTSKLQKILEKSGTEFERDEKEGVLKVFGLKEFNPGSGKQITERLLELGWVPTKFSPTGLPKTDKDSLKASLSMLERGNSGVDSNTDSGVNSNLLKALRELQGFSILEDRRGKFKKWLELYDRSDTRVHGKVLHIGANTHRCSHYDDNMANVPGVTLGKMSLDDFYEQLKNIPNDIRINNKNYSDVPLEPDPEINARIKVIPKTNFKKPKEFKYGHSLFYVWDSKEKLKADLENTGFVPEFTEILPDKYFVSHKDGTVVYIQGGLEGGFGWECRASWIVDEGNVLVGVDAAGIQLRALAHYIDDPEYTKQILSGDIHEYNRQAAGISDRPTAKTFIYAWLLNAGDFLIGTICGIKQDKEEDLINFGKSRLHPFKSDKTLLHYACWWVERNIYEKDPSFIKARKSIRLSQEFKRDVLFFVKGFKVKEKFLDSLPKLREFRLKEIPEATRKGFMVCLDGRKLWIPNEHLAPSLYLQGFEACIMKTAMILYHRELYKKGIPFKQVAFVHDEFQIETPAEYGDIVGTTVCESLKLAGELFKTKCPIDGEYRIGLNWGETH